MHKKVHDTAISSFQAGLTGKCCDTYMHAQTHTHFGIRALTGIHAHTQAYKTRTHSCIAEQTPHPLPTLLLHSLSSTT